ncbi:hypothetical protein E2320_018559 [Naja naja]|nr:hypothetical protein E2320_018559 [Naja naja]
MQHFTFTSNNCDAATEYIEEKFISRQLTEDANLSFVFRKLIEDKEETALEKMSAMVERLANQFGIYKPVTHLFLQYIEQEKVNDAELLLQRNKAINLEKDVVSCKAVYEKMKAKNVGLNELSLKRLAVLLKQYGQPVPFTEPPESFTFYAEKLRNEKESYSSDDD